MFLKKIGNIRGTLAFHLTLWYTMIFVVSSFGAFAVFYFAVSSFIKRDIDEHLLEEVVEYTSLLKLNAGEGIEDELNVGAESEGIGKMFVRLIDPKGTEIFTTNMESWEHAGVSSKALKQLEGGANHVFETLPFPEKPYDTRIIYGYIDLDRILQMGIRTEDDLKFLGLLRRIFGIIIGPFLFLSAFAGWFMARRALAGVEQVTETALDISEGALERRVTIKARGKEIDQLATIFNRMLDRVNALLKGMREVTDNIAHDLKTPITRIRGNAEIHLGSVKTNDRSADFAASTIEECDNLLQMINTMLDISEAEAGIAKLQKTEVQMTKVIQDAVELFQPLAEQKGVTINSDISGNAVVLGDLQGLQRMFVNVLENAVKYTLTGGTVTVSMNKGDKDCTVISVQDTGIGISENDLPYIFKRLYRCDVSRSQPGFGLGLSLAHAIARAHNGDITAFSQPMIGSTFTVILP